MKEKSAKIIFNNTIIPNFFEDLVKNRFKKELSNLEEKIRLEILKVIESFPKSKKGYIRNRLKVKLKPYINLYLEDSNS